MNNGDSRHIPGQVINNAASNAAGTDGGDWKMRLHQQRRLLIVNKIVETLERRLPLSGPEGLQELKKIALRFEEKIYSSATSELDYLRKISLKMIGMENPTVNTVQTNAANSNKSPQDPRLVNMSNGDRSAAQEQVQILRMVNNDEAANAVGMDGGDWRKQIRPDSRIRIVNKIMETLGRHLPLPGPEGVLELKKIAIRSEETTFASATSESDYLRKITLRMMAMQNPMVNCVKYTAANNYENPQDPTQEQVQILRNVNNDEAANAVGMDGVDWRKQLQLDTRIIIVNKITETLERILPLPEPEALLDLTRIALRFEEKIYSEAASQPDYLRKISLKMIIMERKFQNPMANPNS